MTKAEHKRLLRLSAGALLLTQQRTGAMLLAAAKPHIESAAKRVPDDARTGEAIRAIRTAGLAMAPSLAMAVVKGRRMARQAAARRLAEETDTVGGRLIAKSAEAKLAMEAAATDEVAADVVADSLVVQWRAVTMASIVATADDVGTKESVSRSTRLFIPRLDRVATTEIAQAYQEEHLERARLAAKLGEIDAGDVFREWNAYADACPRCLPLNGERVGINESFPGGEVPGSVHVNCCCTEILVTA